MANGYLVEITLTPHYINEFPRFYKPDGSVDWIKGCSRKYHYMKDAVKIQSEIIACGGSAEIKKL